MSEKKRKPIEAETPPVAAPIDETPAATKPKVKRVAEPAPFVHGGTWTNGERVQVTGDPDYRRART